jgi:hypothetical protein
MVSFVTLDEVLGHFPSSVMCVPLEAHIGGDLFGDDSADSPSFGIPSHMVADIKYF